MTALLLKEDTRKRSNQSRRLGELRAEAARIRIDLRNGKITPEEATSKLNQLMDRDRSLFHRFMDL
ncbi:hypothetical protein ORIO_02180 [Cereibacter azotoformans]|uniref:hypothetical protein n=1 Tax=Cereibacter azotoformans TaxID=43057 RepID=UPI000316679F|nr:hypothetical protein [Cereibacter azotoformans]ULB08744.1 hypothetical protein ORIO_02180 [Cereibacter azotoformans]